MGLSIKIAPFGADIIITNTAIAGDTAAITAPIKRASINWIPNILGTKNPYAIISKLAGKKDKNTADGPTFLRSLISRLNPAFMRWV